MNGTAASSSCALTHRPAAAPQCPAVSTGTHLHKLDLERPGHQRHEAQRGQRVLAGEGHHPPAASRDETAGALPQLAPALLLPPLPRNSAAVAPLMLLQWMPGTVNTPPLQQHPHSPLAGAGDQGDVLGVVAARGLHGLQCKGAGAHDHHILRCVVIQGGEAGHVCRNCRLCAASTYGTCGCAALSPLWRSRLPPQMSAGCTKLQPCCAAAQLAWKQADPHCTAWCMQAHLASQVRVSQCAVHAVLLACITAIGGALA